uniref:4.8 kDa non-structural protein n=1 Tax=Betacoronavirus 1 TaxID=694003 RepID=A0A191URC6_9BETC|nr:4.8 kDa non-structural protein [Betacoronavirus 1]
MPILQPLMVQIILTLCLLLFLQQFILCVFIGIDTSITGYLVLRY